MIKRNRSSPTVPRADAEHVGTAEFRRNLAKHLRRARDGQPIVIQERGRDAYLLVRLDEQTPAPIFGCMRERTDYSPGAVVNASETFDAGAMP